MTWRIICKPQQFDSQGHSNILGKQRAARRSRLDVAFERLSEQNDAVIAQHVMRGKPD